MRNRDVIEELLRTYVDALLASGGGQGSHFSPEDRILWMSKEWHAGSYAQLEQALVRMRNQGSQQAIDGIPLRTLWWHLNERYVRVEFRVREVMQTIRGKNGKKGKVPVDTRIPFFSREYSAIARDRRDLCIRLGIDWLVDEFERMGVSPELPRDDWERVAA